MLPLGAVLSGEVVELLLPVLPAPVFVLLPELVLDLPELAFAAFFAWWRFFVRALCLLGFCTSGALCACVVAELPDEPEFELVVDPLAAFCPSALAVMPISEIASAKDAFFIEIHSKN